MRDFGTKVDNTAPAASGLLTAPEDNVRFNELENAVSTSGIPLDGPTGPDSDVRHLAQAQARYASGGQFTADGGATNAYVVTTPLGFILPKAYFRGMRVVFYPANSCTGASTINVNAIGVKKLLAPSGIALVANQIITGLLTSAVYDPAADAGVGAFRLEPWALPRDDIINIGVGAGVKKDFLTPNHRLRSITGINGISVAVAAGGDEIVINGAGLMPAPGGGDPATVCMAPGVASGQFFTWPKVSSTGIWEVRASGIQGSSNQIMSVAIQVSWNDGGSWASCAAIWQTIETLVGARTLTASGRFQISVGKIDYGSSNVAYSIDYINSRQGAAFEGGDERTGTLNGPLPRFRLFLGAVSGTPGLLSWGSPAPSLCRVC